MALAGLALTIGGCSESSTVDPDGGEDAGIEFDATPGEDTGPSGDGGGDGGAEGDIGMMCSSDSDCEGMCISEGDGFPGGYCTSICGSDEDCPAGSACTPVGRGTMVCLDECDPDAEMRECREGYGCATSVMLPSPVCLPGCTDDTDCMDGAECDPEGGLGGAGTCFDPESELGNACTSREDCPADSFCLEEDFAGWPGGTCIGFECDVEADTGCAGDAHCLPSGRGGGICIDGCDSTDDCRDAYECDSSDEYPDRMICSPACTDDSQCSDGNVCNPATGICDDPFDAEELGEPCSTSRDACDGGTCLSEFESGFPGSACVYLGCDATAADDSDGCPGDGVCVEGDEENFCIAGCESGDDCLDGYACEAVDDADSARGMGCFPACTGDDQCANDEFVCNEGTGLCTEAFNDANLGEPCETADDCPGGECISEDSDGYPFGTCVAVGCRLSGDGGEEPCPTDGICVDDEEGDPEIGACLLACDPSASGECRPGYECVDQGDGSGACEPNCTSDDDCAGTCDTDTGLCA